MGSDFSENDAVCSRIVLLHGDAAARRVVGALIAASARDVQVQHLATAVEFAEALAVPGCIALVVGAALSWAPVADVVAAFAKKHAKIQIVVVGTALPPQQVTELCAPTR